MQIIAFIRSVFGILFVVRTMRVFRGRGICDHRALEAIGFFALILISLIEFFDGLSALARGLLTVALALAPALAFYVIELNQIARFRARVPLFLDRWILNLRLGSSVNSARAAALRAEGAPLRALLAPVFENGGDGRRRHLLLRPAILRELEVISRTAHAALERLEALRGHVREASEFRRKSGLAVRQATIQAVVMLLMLVALSVYTVTRYGWSRSGWFVTVAGAVSATGALAMVFLARKGKWTL